MPTKTEDAIAPLVAQMQMRDDQLYQSVVEFAGSGPCARPGKRADRDRPECASVDRPEGRINGPRRQPATSHELKKENKNVDHHK
jgi:hypothetical protein